MSNGYLSHLHFLEEDFQRENGLSSGCVGGMREVVLGRTSSFSFSAV